MLSKIRILCLSSKSTLFECCISILIRADNILGALWPRELRSIQGPVGWVTVSIGLINELCLHHIWFTHVLLSISALPKLINKHIIILWLINGIKFSLSIAQTHCFVYLINLSKLIIDWIYFTPHFWKLWVWPVDYVLGWLLYCGWTLFDLGWIEIKVGIHQGWSYGWAQFAICGLCKFWLGLLF